MEIEKAYFTLPEILDRWSISEADLIYLAENDKLRLSVRVLRLKHQVQHPAPVGHRMLRWTNGTSTSTARNVA